MDVADFYIIRVSYDTSGKRAIRFFIQHNLATRLSEPEWIERELVLTALQRGYTSIVVSPADKGERYSGKHLNVVRVEGTYFLRTDHERIAADELGG
jgi:hypothetical protein